MYLSDAIIIMTSNAGSEHFRKLTSPMGFRSGQLPLDQVQSEINRELERRFPPEFRNRIDQVVLFQPLTKDEVRDIALKYIDQVTSTLKRWNKTLTIEPEALEKLVTDGYSMAYGARFLKRVIDDRDQAAAQPAVEGSGRIPGHAEGRPGRARRRRPTPRGVERPGRDRGLVAGSGQQAVKRRTSGPPFLISALVSSLTAAAGCPLPAACYIGLHPLEAICFHIDAASLLYSWPRSWSRRPSLARRVPLPRGGTTWSGCRTTL